MKRLCCMGLLVGCGLCVPSAFGQEKRLSVIIEHIAGPNLYLNAGRREGLQKQDTVRVMRQGRVLGRWYVISSSSRRSVVTFVGPSFPVARGDTLVIRYTPAPVKTASGQGNRAAGDRPPSLLGTMPQPARRASGRPAPEITGRLIMEFSSLQSETRSVRAGVPVTTRTFTTPALSLRAQGRHLPGGLRAGVHLRLAQRNGPGTLLRPARSLRIYQASLEKTGRRGQVKAGRFYSTHERFSGYWDGLLGYLEGGLFGAGVLAGFEPDRANEGFSSERPKTTVFVTFHAGEEAIRYEADVSVHRVFPQDGYAPHTFAGWTQDLRVRRFRLRNVVQVDRNPATASWIVTRLQVRAAVPLPGPLSLVGRYHMRRPYLLTRSGDPIAYRRDQATAEVNLRLGDGSLGIHATTNLYEQGNGARTYGAFLSLPRLLGGVGLNGSASYWTRGATTARFLSGGLSRSVRRVQARLRYTWYQSDAATRTLQTHTLSASLNFPVKGRVYGSLRGSLQRGRDLANSTLFASLWMQF